MTTRRLLMISFFCVAAWLAFFGDKTPEADTVQAAESRTQPAVAKAADGISESPRQLTKTALVTPILKLRERPTYVPLGGKHVREPVIFASSTWDPAPPKAVAGPPQPPQAPVLPFTYLGKKLEDGVWEVYLAAGENIQIVRPNTTLDGTYRIGKIVPPVLSLTYLPLAQVQTISIGTFE